MLIRMSKGKRITHHVLHDYQTVLCVVSLKMSKPVRRLHFSHFTSRYFTGDFFSRYIVVRSLFIGLSLFRLLKEENTQQQQ